jgi:hypothetical protein
VLQKGRDHIPQQGPSVARIATQLLPRLSMSH